MKISAVRADAPGAETPLLVLPVFQEGDLPAAAASVDSALSGRVASLRGSGEFAGRDCDALLLYPSADGLAAERVLLVGMGRRKGADAERLRRAAGRAAKEAARVRVSALALALPALDGVDAGAAAQAAAEGLVLGAYTFDRMKSEPEDGPKPVPLDEATLLVGEGADEAAAAEGARVGEIVGRAETLARDLGNLPGNVATPTYLGETAERIAREHGMDVTVLDKAALEEEGMKALLSVAQGSAQEPRLIVLEHRGGAEGARPIVLVGKGLTFDAGGISIKPSSGMEEMKFDMGGGAAVLGAMQAIAELGVKANVVGIVPSSENLLGAAAMKPGDIIGTHLGKTIEVVNTDAEGRLILADAISYARRFDPAVMVDAATLTGACMIALGHHASGLMGNDEALVEELRAAGERSGEIAWPLPMLDGYREQIKSDYADIKNSGGRPAGAITAGWFLREFVGDFPWAHLDVAGTAFGEHKLPYHTKGGTGAPTRLFVEWVRSRAG